jgi:signal-transduction protein with cAMP-binding, CBS, and nucleotidyltransferase domain
MHTAEDILKDKKKQDMVCVPHNQSVYKTLEKMVSRRIGAILVKKGNDIVGIWTERDFMRNTLTQGFDPHKDRIDKFMTAPVHSADHTATLSDLMDMFLGLFVRHMLIKKDGTPIGMISIGDVVRANLLEKDQTIRELNSMASWQYYENWGWNREKGDQRS